MIYPQLHESARNNGLLTSVAVLDESGAANATNVPPRLTLNRLATGGDHMAHEAHNARIDSAQDNFPLPDYRLLFRLHTWLTNTTLDWAFDLSEPPEALTDADDALSALVEMACAREGKTYGEMLRAIHAGEFDRG